MSDVVDVCLRRRNLCSVDLFEVRAADAGPHVNSSKFSVALSSNSQGGFLYVRVPLRLIQHPSKNVRTGSYHLTVSRGYNRVNGLSVQAGFVVSSNFLCRNRIGFAVGNCCLERNGR